MRAIHAADNLPALPPSRRISASASPASENSRTSPPESAATCHFPRTLFLSHTPGRRLFRLLGSPFVPGLRAFDRQRPAKRKARKPELPRQALFRCHIVLTFRLGNLPVSRNREFD